MVKYRLNALSMKRVILLLHRYLGIAPASSWPRGVCPDL